MTLNKALAVLFVALFPAAQLFYAHTADAKQVLNVGIGSDIPSLDPQKMEDNISARVGADLYECLLTESEEGKIIPGIASSFEISPNRLDYTFKLRDDAKFSDGSPITAEDVVYSFQRLSDPKVASTYAYVINDVKNAKQVNEGKAPLNTLGVTAVGKDKVKITLDRPVPYFEKIVAMAELGIVKKQNVEHFKDAFTQPGNLVSSGAYKLTYWKIGDKATAQKNPYYWNAKNVAIEEVNYFPISDVNSELQMYQSGQLDFTYDIASDKFKSLKQTIPTEIAAHPYLSIYYIDLNNEKFPFKGNKKLRQAFSMAVDRKIMTENVTGRGELSINDIVPYGTANYSQQKYEWESLPADERIKAAQKLYGEAGFSKNNPLTVTISYNTNVLHKKVMLALGAMWTKAFRDQGLKVDLVNQEWKVFLKTRQQGDYIVARDGWIADYNDTSSFLDLLRTGNPQNNSHYSNPKFDALLKDASSEMNLKKRQAIMQQATQIMMEDYPIIPLYSYVTTHLVKSKVKGYTGKNALDHQYTRNFYIDEKGR